MQLDIDKTQKLVYDYYILGNNYIINGLYILKKELLRKLLLKRFI